MTYAHKRHHQAGKPNAREVRKLMSPPTCFGHPDLCVVWNEEPDRKRSRPSHSSRHVLFRARSVTIFRSKSSRTPEFICSNTTAAKGSRGSRGSGSKPEGRPEGRLHGLPPGRWPGRRTDSNIIHDVSLSVEGGNTRVRLGACTSPRCLSARDRERSTRYKKCKKRDRRENGDRWAGDQIRCSQQ